MALTMEMLMKDPHAFGLPTFDEYLKAPDDYRKSFKRLMTELELGPQAYRKDWKGVKYWVGLNCVDSASKAVDVMNDMGWDPLLVKHEITVEKTTGGKDIYHVRFRQGAPVRDDEDEQVSGLEKQGS